MRSAKIQEEFDKKREFKFVHRFWKAIWQSFKIKTVHICWPELLLGTYPTDTSAVGHVCMQEDGHSALETGDSLLRDRDQVSGRAAMW